MWVFPSRPQWWLLPRWSLGCKHCHSQEARRHKNLQGCSLFPWPSLSTIQIDIFGAAKKSAKNSAGPGGCVRCGCGIWGPPEPASPSKKLICEWRGGRRAALGAELYACQAARPAHREGGERTEKVWCREEALCTPQQCRGCKIRGKKFWDMSKSRMEVGIGFYPPTLPRSIKQRGYLEGACHSATCMILSLLTAGCCICSCRFPVIWWWAVRTAPSLLKVLLSIYTTLPRRPQGPAQGPPPPFNVHIKKRKEKREREKKNNVLLRLCLEYQEPPAKDTRRLYL